MDLVLSHPCKHRPAQPLATAGIHPSHLTLNLGHEWSCSRCKAHHSVRTRAKRLLSKECKGDRKKGGQKPSPVPRVLLLYLLVEFLPAIQSFLSPKGLQILRLSGPKHSRFSASHGPDLEDSRPNQVLTKSKGKAKAKPKANSVAGLLSVASFFKTVAEAFLGAKRRESMPGR